MNSLDPDTHHIYLHRRKAKTNLVPLPLAVPIYEGVKEGITVSTPRTYVLVTYRLELLTSRTPNPNPGTPI